MYDLERTHGKRVESHEVIGWIDDPEKEAQLKALIAEA